MGRNKARLRIRGKELWRRQLSVLEHAGARPLALALRPRQRSYGWKGGEIRDVAAGAGPMGALAAALSFSASPWVAVLAVDLPQMDAAWFRRLRKRCRTGVGAVVRGPEGFEPLAAIYPSSARSHCLAHLAMGRFSLQSLLRSLVRHRLMVVLPLRAIDRPRLIHWNTPGDLH
jgi:molybdopterin-guanine dinucleotide biosynthesis protein A